MLVILGAGLLAADQLRRLLGSWTDATLIAAVATLCGLLLRTFSRKRPREVQMLQLPLGLAQPMDPDFRNRVLAFVLFLVALVVVPVLFA